MQYQLQLNARQPGVGYYTVLRTDAIPDGVFANAVFNNINGVGNNANQGVLLEYNIALLGFADDVPLAEADILQTEFKFFNADMLSDNMITIANSFFEHFNP